MPEYSNTWFTKVPNLQFWRLLSIRIFEPLFADFEGYSMRNAPPPKVGVQSLQILQNHYPERLALAVSYHPPWLFQIMYKVLTLTFRLGNPHFIMWKIVSLLCETLCRHFSAISKLLA